MITVLLKEIHLQHIIYPFGTLVDFKKLIYSAGENRNSSGGYEKISSLAAHTRTRKRLRELRALKKAGIYHNWSGGRGHKTVVLER